MYPRVVGFPVMVGHPVNYVSNKMYISDKQLQVMELCIDDGIKVHVEDLEGERISQMCQCTQSHSWHRGVQQND